MDTKRPFNPDIIKAIVGLGNPGSTHYKTRHSIGFRVVDHVAHQLNIAWKRGDVLEWAEGVVFRDGNEPQKIFFVKPMTYMNSSGDVMPWLRKKGIALDEVVVIHDELEKPFGSLGIRFGGSPRGHNGLRSIINVAGMEFWRLRFGIGRPLKREDVSTYVLARFTPEEQKSVDALVEDAANLLIR